MFEAIEMLADQLAFELDYFSGVSDLYDSLLWFVNGPMTISDENFDIFGDLVSCWDQIHDFKMSLDFRTYDIADKYGLYL